MKDVISRITTFEQIREENMTQISGKFFEKQKTFSGSLLSLEICNKKFFLNN